jgi:hypothetical protein
MHAVFYDLETTDKHPIGQILNYCFICLDSSGKRVSELSGLVKLSRLQIPDPGAILANRTDVLLHQQRANDSEPEAMKRIAEYLSACIEASQGAIALLGYNSSRFDLNYLRTSFIRNGISPYWNGKIVPRDLLHVVQKAYLVSKDFRELIRAQRVGEKRLSLSLQTVGHALGLLAGEQAHESHEDVELTINVARWLKEHCDLEATSFEAYEGGRLHSTAGSGAVYLQEQPEYDLAMDNFKAVAPVTLLDASGRAALWIDLQRYADQQTPQCIMWRSAAKHAFFVSQTAVQDRELQRLARAALQQFKAITLKNFFGETTCDIEMDIYRIDFDSLDLFSRAIQKNDKEVLKGCANQDLKILWLRRQLASAQASISDPKTADVLRKYALHRYGGKLQLARTLDQKPSDDQGQFHTTLGDMTRALVQQKEAAVLQGNQADVKLLDSLERYIRDSDIVKVAGHELVPHWVV